MAKLGVFIMKHLIKLGMALLIVAIVLGMGACKFEDDSSESKSGVDFTNYTGQDAAIFVRNTTNQNLVAFKGTLSAANLLGGIPGGTGGTHGISKAKNPAHFPSNQATEFAMILITEEQYNANKSNLSSLQQTPFTRVYVFYNSQSDNEGAYEISDKLGGSQKVKLINNTNYNVELRERGIAGPTLGYAPANMTETTLSVAPGQYMLYPVFKYYNAARQQVGTIHPKGAGGNYYVWGFILESSNETIQLNLNTALTNFNASKTLGAAWMIIHNNTTMAIEVNQGVKLITDAMGYSYFNPGSTKTIQVNMASAGGESYASQQTVSGYSVGFAGITANILSDVNNSNTFILKSDNQYSVIVSGDINDGYITATIEMSNETAIDFNAFLTGADY